MSTTTEHIAGWRRRLEFCGTFGEATEAEAPRLIDLPAAAGSALTIGRAAAAAGGAEHAQVNNCLLQTPLSRPSGPFRDRFQVKVPSF